MSQRKANYVAGAWLAGGHWIENRNPSDVTDLIGLFDQASPALAARAIDAAAAACPIWAQSGLEKRYSVLMAIGQELMARAQELGHLLSREEGKPLAEGAGEVYRSGQFFTYFAAEVLRQIGDRVDSVRDGIEIDVRREPLGVVAVISPWNFPMATASWKIAPALAFGNAVIWKPANLTPGSAWALAEIISRQDLPAGTFNLVMGAGDGVGQLLAESPRVNGITFTGSLEVGRRVAAAAAKNLTKFQLEMGSKNPLLIMDDADLDLAVAVALNGAFGGTGQKCTASSRLIVHSRVHDAFVEKLVAGAKALQVGHALAAETQIGPVVSAAQLKSNLDYVKLAQEQGGERACGGEALERPTPGHYMSPAVILNTRNDMRVNREEIFGPVTCVIRCDSFDEAVAIANDTPFGLTSGIVTRSLARASQFRRQSKAGCVMVNLPTAGTDYHVPFGGRGASSFGPREQGRYAVEFYTQMKTSYVQPGAAAA
jgi:acyl-CoA reductase-like NAD-dependent aldehyde dehydrogenase